MFSFLCFRPSKVCQVTQATYNSLTIIARRGGFFDVESMFFSFVLFGFDIVLFIFLFFLLYGFAARQMRVACALHL
jgi:hypothetical protein